MISDAGANSVNLPISAEIIFLSSVNKVLLAYYSD